MTCPVQEIKIQEVLSPMGRKGFIVPEGYHLIKAPDYTTYDEKLTFEKLNEFSAYAKEFKREESRIIPNNGGTNPTFVCDFQYHGATKANKDAHDHSVTMMLKKDPDFQRWENHAGKWMSQREFADFMADYAKDFYDVDKTDILNLAKKIKIIDSSTLNSEYENGGLDVIFQSSEKAMFGDKPMPEQFEIALPIYHGFSAYIMPLRVFWAKEGGKCKLKYEFIRLHKITDKAFADAADMVALQTGIKVYGYGDSANVETNLDKSDVAQPSNGQADHDPETGEVTA